MQFSSTLGGLIRRIVSRLQLPRRPIGRFIEAMEPRRLLSAPIVSSAEFNWKSLPHQITVTFDQHVVGVGGEDF